MHVETKPIDALGRGSREANGSLEVRSSRRATASLDACHAAFVLFARMRLPEVCVHRSRTTHARRSAVSGAGRVRSTKQMPSPISEPISPESPSRQIAALRRDRMPRHGVWDALIVVDPANANGEVDAS